MNIDTLKQIALDAGKIVKEGYYSHKEVSHKGIVDLVTEFDVKTETFIINRLKKAFPDHTLVGEESHHGSYHYDKVIYIDPIDGTTNFIHGIPHLAISLGVWENGEPTLAVVHNPILDELFWAVKGEGAFCNGQRLEVSTQDTLQNALVATGFPYAKVNAGVEYHWVINCMTNLLPHIQDIRRLGAAAIDLCYLAQGKVEAFYEIDLKPWDVAAGILIVQEAGGQISNVDNKTYDFDDKSIVASNGKVHTQLLAKLEKI
ncbi:inositol monophosphatase family protein [Sulfurovum sp. zt1-1]|uniref:Inositol-1-monophosphatase n=1 Tax=Sulfurovum zhangzhouensis TaxID=3019067 RepID=A0ABT7R0Y7_9BACT|nr:inositol monophosphatase family protein [Sulfurovum zhangzhouensis]MDM5272439.1 inositol monophosphatase family protein [Sulfurovum zhangzhouensis]